MSSATEKVIISLVIIRFLYKKGANELKRFWQHLDQLYFREFADEGEAINSIEELIKAVKAPFKGERASNIEVEGFITQSIHMSGQ